MAHPMRIDRFLYMGREAGSRDVGELETKRAILQLFLFFTCSCFFFFLFYKKMENNKKAIFYMCVYTQTVTAIGPERKREREMTSGASSPAGGGDESVHLLGSLLLFSSIENILWFPSVASCAAQSIKTWPRRKPAALHYIRRSAHTHKF